MHSESMLDRALRQRSFLPLLIVCYRLGGVLAAAAAAAAGAAAAGLAAAPDLARLFLAAAAGLALRASCRLAGASWLPTSPPAGGARRGFLSSLRTQCSVSNHSTTESITLTLQMLTTQSQNKTFIYITGKYG